MFSRAVVVADVGVGVFGIHVGGGEANDVGGFVSGRGAAASSCMWTIAQPAKPIASASTPVHAKRTATRPHVIRHDWRSGTVSGSSADHASSAPSAVGNGTSTVGSPPVPTAVDGSLLCHIRLLAASVACPGA